MSEKIEERLAHLERLADELNEVVTRKSRVLLPLNNDGLAVITETVPRFGLGRRAESREVQQVSHVAGLEPAVRAATVDLVVLGGIVLPRIDRREMGDPHRVDILFWVFGFEADLGPMPCPT